jgi:L-lactate utilization protein LutC
MFDQPATDSQILKTVSALKQNNITPVVVDTAEQAKAQVLELIPDQSEVLTMSSVTLDTIGISQELNSSSKYISLRAKLNGLNRDTDHRQMQMIGASPAWAIGSFHALTETGQIVVASNTGSQLPAYVYGADNVIFVAGTQKIVPNLDTASKRVYEFVLPKESERANAAYHITTGSFVSKLLIINRELKPGRITVVLVKQHLGF